MIGKLTGSVSSINTDNLILDVKGVGYLVYMSVVAINQLSSDSSISLFIETCVKEDSITLFGFITEDDKKLFNLLKTVQGVGPKLALTIMSLERNNIISAILLQDYKKIQSVPGVGNKVATRIVNELKGKIEKNVAHSTFTNFNKNTTSNDLNSIMNEALAALKNLGYSDKEAKKAVNYVLTHSANKNITIEDIVRQSLSYFSHI